MGRLNLSIIWLCCVANSATAHASKQGFVLLLPTQAYIIGGVVSVALTFVLIAVVSEPVSRRIFAPILTWKSIPHRPTTLSSFVGFLVMCALLYAGFFGPHDPTGNLLPLAVWSLFWIAFVVFQGVFGDLWRYVNPWFGPWKLLRVKPRFHLPKWVSYWPALISFLAFSAVLLAHPVPSDPDTLAAMVASYWLFHFAGMLLFGSRWLRQCEGLSVVLTAYGRGAILGRSGLGILGWKTLRGTAPPISLAVIMVTLLAVGSFDGINETFWWMGEIGVNPLQFPGRTDVAFSSLIGLIVAVPTLVAAYGFSVWLGVRILGEGARFGEAFRTFAPAILPIALGYHLGHYLPSFLVDIQYVAKIFNTYFGLEEIHVTTGFFNSLASVRIIWLSQAGAVVIGHIVAILLSHVLALHLFGSHKRATLSQLPLAVFMVAYTIFGLWLLASPRV